VAKHTPPGDPSFIRSLLYHVGAAVALVVVVAAAFWGVGQLRPPNADAPVVAADPDVADPAGEPSPPAASEPTSDPTSEVTPDPTPDVTPDPTPAVTPEPTPAVTPEPTADDEPASGTTDDDRQFAPADISIQILDAVLDGTGDDAARVADQLAADGYRVVARNQAVRRYDQTTVMYTSGNEAKARQLAAVYGYARVEPQPGNLSDSVDVHLVVGADA
jgi:outer membrane biosynthesis protein TonB